MLGKLRHRGAKWLAQKHTADNRQSQKADSRFLTPKSMLLTRKIYVWYPPFHWSRQIYVYVES